MPWRSNMDLEDITEVLNESQQVLRDCFAKFKLDEIFLSFNGGKDCTVLLNLTINVLKDIYKCNDVIKDLNIVYIRTKGPFREMESFVKETEDYYGVKLMVTEGEMKTTLMRLLEQNDKLKACLMGTRRTDPYCERLEFMQNTDPSWPQIVRVSPLLNWSYHQIWSYILKQKVPYCSLYDEGYTSIGSIHNTRPNPSLISKDRYGHITYHPAWMLLDASEERAGRGSVSSANGHAVIRTVENGHKCISAAESDKL